MSVTPTARARSAHGLARQAGRSEIVTKAARIGLAARGLVYALIGVLAAQVALGGSERADQKGAIQKIAEQPFGKVVLWLVVVGFFGYGLWRLTEAAWGRRDELDDKKRAVKRVESLASGLLYLVFGASVLKTVTGGGSSGGDQKALTARVMDSSGGELLVALAGLVVIGVAIALTVKGLRTDFEKHLERFRMSLRTYDVVRRLGQAGYVSRGVVFFLVGVFVVKSAMDHDPNKAGGLDVALKSVAGAPFGVFLLLVAAAGLVCFGAYSLAESRYRRL